MLDIAFVCDNLDAVRANCANRNVKADLDAVVRLAAERRRLISDKQVLEQKKNELSAQVKTAKDQAARQPLIDESKAAGVRIAEMEQQLGQVLAGIEAVLMTLPNMTHPDAPVGKLPEDNKVIKTVGTPRTFDFAPKDHVAIAEKLDLVDFEAGARVAGQKFYFLKNEAVLLELALIQYALQTVIAKGYTPIITPDLARVDVLEGIGFMPRDDAATRQVYTIADSDLCLVGTAEITLGGMHMCQTFEPGQLPRRYVGLSHCFRTEAGAPGRDTKGLYRVHQFTKVEMFAYCAGDVKESDAIHQEILAIEEAIFQGLGLAYQVIDTCTGDLGGPAYRKYDLEAWMPGRGEKGEYGEVTSTSNCTDFQVRRLNIRYKTAGQKGTKITHTLNGTAVACTRALVAILENYQNADGSVTVPEVLRPWVGKERIAR